MSMLLMKIAAISVTIGFVCVSGYISRLKLENMSIIFEAEITKRLTAFTMIFQRLEVFKIQMRVYLVFTTPNLGLSDIFWVFTIFFTCRKNCEYGYRHANGMSVQQIVYIY